MIDVVFKLLHVITTTTTFLAKVLEICENANCFFHTHLNDSKIFLCEERLDSLITLSLDVSGDSIIISNIVTVFLDSSGILVRHLGAFLVIRNFILLILALLIHIIIILAVFS